MTTNDNKGTLHATINRDEGDARIYHIYEKAFDKALKKSTNPIYHANKYSSFINTYMHDRLSTNKDVFNVITNIFEADELKNIVEDEYKDFILPTGEKSVITGLLEDKIYMKKVDDEDTAATGIYLNAWAVFYDSISRSAKSYSPGVSDTMIERLSNGISDAHASALLYMKRIAGYISAYMKVYGGKDTISPELESEVKDLFSQIDTVIKSNQSLDIPLFKIVYKDKAPHDIILYKHDEESDLLQVISQLTQKTMKLVSMAVTTNTDSTLNGELGEALLDINKKAHSFFFRHWYGPALKPAAMKFYKTLTETPLSMALLVEFLEDVVDGVTRLTQEDVLADDVYTRISTLFDLDYFNRKTKD